MEVDAAGTPHASDGDPESRTNSNATSAHAAAYGESSAHNSTSDIISIFSKSDGLNGSQPSHEVRALDGTAMAKGHGPAESDYSKLLGSNDLGIGFVDDDDLDNSGVGASGFAKNAEIPSDVHDIALGTCIQNDKNVQFRCKWIEWT